MTLRSSTQTGSNGARNGFAGRRYSTGAFRPFLPPCYLQHVWIILWSSCSRSGSSLRLHATLGPISSLPFDVDCSGCTPHRSRIHGTDEHRPGLTTFLCCLAPPASGLWRPTRSPRKTPKHSLKTLASRPTHQSTLRWTEDPYAQVPRSSEREDDETRDVTFYLHGALLAMFLLRIKPCNYHDYTTLNS